MEFGEFSRPPCKSEGKSPCMQIPELLMIKDLFLHTLPSYCAFNTKSRRFPWTYMSPWVRLPFVWEFLFTFLSKLYQRSTYLITFSNSKKSDDFFVLHFFLWYQNHCLTMSPLQLNEPGKGKVQAESLETNTLLTIKQCYMKIWTLP